MNKPLTTAVFDEEAALAARAAWLHFAGGKTQGEVAELLGVQSTKAHRLIAKARSEGLIRVFVEGPIAGCIDLEEQIKAQFGLAMCEVVPNIDDGPLPLRTLGMAGARFMRALIESRQHDLVGIGHGRTLAAAADLMAGMNGTATRFVSLLGGLTRRFAASPFDVIHKLAERTGAEAYVMPVPFFANSARDRQVLEAQYGVSDVIAMAKQATLYIAGIGEVSRDSFLASAGMLDADDVDDVMRTGAAAELLGHFFSADGKHLATRVAERALAPRLSELESHRIIALAGGTSKTKAVRAVLASRLLHGLIIDETSARQLVAPRQKPKARGGAAA